MTANCYLLTGSPHCIAQFLQHSVKAWIVPRFQLSNPQIFWAKRQVSCPKMTKMLQSIKNCFNNLCITILRQTKLLSIIFRFIRHYFITVFPLEIFFFFCSTVTHKTHQYSSDTCELYCKRKCRIASFSPQICGVHCCSCTDAQATKKQC